MRPSTSLRMRKIFSGIRHWKMPRTYSPHPERSRRAHRRPCNVPSRVESDKNHRMAELRTDIRAGDWVDRRAPRALRPYIRLARLDRPIGTWLLLFPCWWGIAFAAERWPDWRLIALFGIGAVVMRGAGCTFNDIVDRDFDARVERTSVRPIPSGAVSVKAAIVFMLLQLVIGAAILLSLNRLSILLGFLVIALIAT